MPYKLVSIRAPPCTLHSLTPAPLRSHHTHCITTPTTFQSTRAPSRAHHRPHTCTPHRSQCSTRAPSRPYHTPPYVFPHPHPHHFICVHHINGTPNVHNTPTAPWFTGHHYAHTTHVDTTPTPIHTHQVASRHTIFSCLTAHGHE